MRAIDFGLTSNGGLILEKRLSVKIGHRKPCCEQGLRRGYELWGCSGSRDVPWGHSWALNHPGQLLGLSSCRAQTVMWVCCDDGFPE